MTGNPPFRAGEMLSFPFRVSMADQQQFARISGDTNPMHLDPVRAKALGFAAPLVYGGLIVAKISCVVGMHWPGDAGVWGDLNIRFRRPLLVDDEAVLSATIDQVSPASRSMTIKLEITAANAKVATATALVVLFAQTDQSDIPE